MDKALFEELLESLREARAIVSGPDAAACRP